MPLVVVGRIGRAHGLRGEVTLDGCDLTPVELHDVKHFTWRGRGGAERELELETARPANTRMLVRFRGVDDRAAAAALSAGQLFASSERLPDPGAGTAYAFQLVGLDVVTEEGRALGVLESILTTAAHPVYIVQGEREWLLPAIPSVVKHVDLEARRITVALPAGLEEV